LIGSLGTVIYRLNMEDAIPAGVSASVADTARESIVGATSAATDLPAPLASDLLESTHRAFATALDAVAVLSAVVLVGLAVRAAVTLRRLRPLGEPPPGEEKEAGRPPASLSEIASDGLEAHTHHP
jgi:DHA2 family multidrug resistance protein-like MFS transporter